MDSAFKKEKNYGVHVGLKSNCLDSVHLWDFLCIKALTITFLHENRGQIWFNKKKTGALKSCGTGILKIKVKKKLELFSGQFITIEKQSSGN